MAGKKFFLSFYLCQRFGSLTNAAKKIGVGYCRLSRFINNAAELNAGEMKKLQCLKKMTQKQLSEAATSDGFVLSNTKKGGDR